MAGRGLTIEADIGMTANRSRARDKKTGPFTGAGFSYLRGGFDNDNLPQIILFSGYSTIPSAPSLMSSGTMRRTSCSGMMLSMETQSEL